jgi:hypothetical protein
LAGGGVVPASGGVGDGFGEAGGSDDVLGAGDRFGNQGDVAGEFVGVHGGARVADGVACSRP